MSNEMKVLSITKIGHNVYEIVTQSDKYGIVKQSVLMLMLVDNEKSPRALRSC